MNLLGVAVLYANAQMINLQGVVSNSSGKPISNAIVSLVRQKMMDTTGADGKYSFISTAVKKVPAIVPQTSNISLNNSVLQFALSTQSPMKVEIFNLTGKLLRREMNMNAAAGTYRFDISKNYRTANVLLIKAAIGKSEVSFRYMPIHGGQNASSFFNIASTVSSSSSLSAIADVVDTITVTATGYQTKSIPITSLDNQQMNISLNSSDGKNAPEPSVGCGKTLGDINKSGTYTVKSSGTNRTFIIDIPPNYDKNKPYRLIFGMHCMGGSAIKVAGTDDGRDQTAYFYHIKNQADKDNIQCIYVAPQGDPGGTWNPSKDPTFFSDLLKLVKDTLCVDTTRVFCSGFSFGAMYSYALSLAFPKQLRAVACYAPANWNFDPQPTNNHVPLAYFQTTGTQDGLCSWVNNDSQKKGGKYCLLQHAEDNGCNTNITIQLATNGKHVVTEFEGCKDGYPVRFCSFQGGHQCNATDSGTNFDWIPVETWEFFKRF